VKIAGRKREVGKQSCFGKEETYFGQNCPKFGVKKKILAPDIGGVFLS
jgi:hypothetical protein